MSSSQQINILFISSNSDIAGGENYLLTAFKLLDKKKFKPIVMVPGEGRFYNELVRLGIEAFVMKMNYFWLTPPDEWYRHLSSIPARVRYLADFIRSNKISLVHTNSNIIFEGALAARLTGVHHLFFAHLEFLPQNPIFQRFTLDAKSYAQMIGDLSCHIIAVSNTVAQTYSPPIDINRIQVVHNGLEFEKFDVALENKDGSLRSELGLSDNSLIVSAIGRVHPDKGFDYYIEAAEIVVRQNPRLHFLIVGKDEDIEFCNALRSRVKELNISEKVLFLGQRDDVPRILAETDIFVLSSRVEGHPFVLLEAMACACASIATRCGGVEETITDDTGYIVDIGDIQATALNIMKLADDSDLRNEIGLSARKRVKKYFDANSCVKSLADAYDLVLSQPKPLPGSYPIDLLLQAITENAYLGNQVVQLNERVKNLEHLADKFWKNPIYRVAKKIVGH
ncbi:glycosyltransferase [Methylomonas koyamae]|uniref:glycosyltransferase n=1 Tax=Methylomonas koyamae TaxID=702114 RepID=UPI002872B2A4|nr:glycosyltransferase [Methylomonas koyamae]WNB78118.1 glycosyltransferase [Methylomonas koyamae]